MRNDPTRCVKTLMIGAVDAIEEEFGHLWGANKADGQTTAEEDDNYELFMKLREKIMDIGNREICRIKGEKWIKKNSKL